MIRRHVHRVGPLAHLRNVPLLRFVVVTLLLVLLVQHWARPIGERVREVERVERVPAPELCEDRHGVYVRCWSRPPTRLRQYMPYWGDTPVVVEGGAP